MTKKKKSNKLTYEQRMKLLLTPCKNKKEMYAWIRFHLGLELPNCTVSRYANTNPFDVIWELYEILVLKKNLQNIEELLCVAGRGSGKTLGMAILELMVILHDKRDTVHVGAIQTQAERCYLYIKNFMYNSKLKDLMVPPKVPEDQRLLEKSNMSKSYFNIGLNKVTLEVLPCTLKACPTVDQIIKTNNGTIKAGDIKVGDKLESPLGYVDVIDTEILEKECIEIELEDKTVISGTLDHKVWTNKGWVELQHLTKNHEIITEFKVCLKCKLKLPVNKFTARKDSIDGYINTCKPCRNESNRIYYRRNKLNRKPCVSCGKDRNLDSQRVHKELCKTCYRCNQRSMTKLKKNKSCTICRTNSSTKWYQNNVCRNCYRNTSYNYKKNNNHSWYIRERISNNLRTRLNSAIKNNHKVGSAVKDLNCSISELKTHLESQFQPGMSWDNYGRNGWHIDHIKPLSKFNLENKKELKEACNYKNLQPLWAKDNLRKSNKYEN